LEDVSKYDGKDGSKAYVIINDVVFDVTDLWGKGRHHGAKAGQDLTEKFVNSGHALKTYEKLPVVGGVKR